MISPINQKIALAHLTSRVKQGLVAVLSVTFGISMYIFMNSFMTGVNDAQTELAFSALAHVRIYNDGPEDRSNLLVKHFPGDYAYYVHNARTIQYTEGIRNSEVILQQVAEVPGVAGVAPQINLNVFFRNGATQVNGQLSGIDVAAEEALFHTSDFMVKGDWDALAHRSDGVIVGIGMAQKLGLQLNDNLVVMTGEGITRNFRVIGIFETTMAGADNSKAYTRINSARQLLSKNQGYVTDIQVNMQDFEQADAAAEQLAGRLPYQVESWKVANGQLDAGNELRNIIAIAVSLTILLVAGFGIYNIMNMTVNEKIKEIAILKAMGFAGRDVVQIFLSQSLIIGLLGGLVGMGLGYVVSAIVNHVPFEIATLTTLPVAFRPIDYAMAISFGLVTTFVAGYLPAKKASQVDPVSIIRG